MNSATFITVNQRVNMARLLILVFLSILVHASAAISNLDEDYSLNSELENSKPLSEDVITVAQDGSGQFESIQAAIDSAPDWSKQRTTVFVKRGVYREKVYVGRTKTMLSLVGEGASQTYVTWDDSAAKRGVDGTFLGTVRSSTLDVLADDFIAKNISIANDSPDRVQAVALKISGDRAAFYRVNLYGYQDTLFDDTGRHFYLNCKISGAMDFIFGNARSLFMNCVLDCKGKGVIAAHGRDNPAAKTGFSFVGCKIQGQEKKKTALARAWGPYSTVVFSNTQMGDVIVPQGWSIWRQKSYKRNVLFGEFNCTGPGSSRKGRAHYAKKMIYEEALPFLGISYIDGASWLTEF